MRDVTFHCVSVCVCVERNDQVGESLSKKEGMNNGDQGPLYVLDVNKIANVCMYVCILLRSRKFTLF